MPGTAQVNVNPRKIPRQARAQATVEAIIVATAQLLTEQGFVNLTTARVAGHGKTRREPLIQARAARAQYGSVGHYFTGPIKAPLTRFDAWLPTEG